MFPWEFIEFESRVFCGRSWFRPGDGMYGEIEMVARKHADVRGVEIDIISCGISDRGEIMSREREGLRVYPYKENTLWM